MATRESILVFKDQGAEGVTGRVIHLAEALDRQKRSADQLAPVLKKTTVDAQAFGSIAQSSSAKITSLTNSLGPLGAGLGAVSRQAPAAAMGLLQMVVAQEKAALMQRSLNVALMGGAATMLTGAVAAAAYADDALRAADTYASLQARIRTFSEGNIEAARTERELYAAARESRTGVVDLTTLYTRLTPAVEDYGRSQKDALAITQLTSKALAIQGADIREQAAATVQFSQSIASGVMRGDELRSLLESSPQLLRYIAQNLEINGKVGVAFSSLRKLGEEGALTTERIIDALMRAQPAIEKDFINAPKTAQQGWVILKDEIIRTVGSIDKTLGGQQAVVKWLNEMATKAEVWRQSMLVDPAALDPIRSAAEFIGEAAGSIGTLGKVAVDNFDLLVNAGQALIALKLGSVMASWFAAAATGAQAAIGKLEAYKAAAQVQAATTAMPNSVKAAQGLRAAATGADLRATEMLTAAEVKLASAVASRTAAYQAGNAVNQLKIALDQQGIVGTQRQAALAAAEAQATTLNTLATKAESQAKTAAAAASNAAAVAVTRNSVAKAAEAAVTVQLTTAQVALNAAKTVGLGLYNLLGGAIGLITLALGGLVYAAWKANEAYKENNEQQRQAMVVSDQLRRITDQMTVATWAQIPALEERSRKLLENATNARIAAEAEIRLNKARLDGIKGKPGQVMGGDFVEGGAAEAGRVERKIKDNQRNLDEARADEWKKSQERIRASLIKNTVEASTIQRQLSSGTDLAGRPLTADGKTSLEGRLSNIFQTGQKAVDEWEGRLKRQQTIVAGSKGGARDGANEVADVYSEIFNTATELVATASTNTRGKPPGPTPNPQKSAAVSVSGGVSAAYDDLLKAGFLNLSGGKGYAANNGGVTLNGSDVVARSDDEATALTKYVKVVEALNDATDAQLAKRAAQLGVSGRSRDEMKAAAGAILEREMATSKAAQADERWADIQAQMEGKSRAQITAERTINSLRQDGTAISENAASAYVAWVVAKQKIDDLQKGMQVSQPLVQRGFEAALAGSPTPVDSRGVIDEVKATQQLMDAKAAVILDRDRAVRDEIEKRLKSGQILEQDVAKETTDAKAAYDIAVEIATQDQLLEIRKARLKENLQSQEQQIAETSDAIVGALTDLTMGGSLKDVGKRLGNEMLSALYEEILFNPLRQQIQIALRSLMNAQGGGGGGGGLFGALINAGLGMVGRANLDTTVSATIASNPNLFYAGRVPGYVDGRVPAAQIQNMIFRGRGGPRGDDNLARISDGEAIINADATSMSARILHLVNSGKINDSILGYANGRVPAGSLSMGPIVSPVPRGEGDVILNNMTGVSATATRRRDEQGNMQIDLRPLADQMARAAGQSGATRRGLSQSPQPKLRG